MLLTGSGRDKEKVESSMGPVFTCSIDDGHPSDMRAAELLDKYGLGATFYIPVRNREDMNLMTPAQIRLIGKRFEIGSHTYDHCYLNYVDVREAYFQIAESKRLLEDLTEREVSGFCYPGGKYTRRDVKLVQACGFRYARTTMNLCLDSGRDPFEMPTTIQFFPHGRAVYLRNFAAAGGWIRRSIGLGVALRHAHWIDRMYALLDHACNQHGVFHLWWHSKQVDELNAWRELESFLSHAASRVAPENRVNNAQLAARRFDGGLVAAPGY
jgi:peptidoglycan/xylan/chitin deacetylase (PgdA/CDA1 family)